MGDKFSKAPFLNCITDLPLETVPSGKMSRGNTD